MKLENYLKLNYDFVEEIPVWEDLQEEIKSSVSEEVFKKYYELGNKLGYDIHIKKQFWNLIQESGIYKLFQRYEKFCIQTCTEFISRRIRGEKVLDLGIGDGVKTVWYALRRPKVQFFGVDFLESALEEVEERKNRFNVKNLKLVNANIRSLPFSDETFDTLTACKSFHEFQIDGYGAMSSFEITVPEACRIVKKGGLILGSLPVPHQFAGEEIGFDLGACFRWERATNYSFKYVQDPSDNNNLILFSVRR